MQMLLDFLVQIGRDGVFQITAGNLFEFLTVHWAILPGKPRAFLGGDLSHVPYAAP